MKPFILILLAFAVSASESASDQRKSDVQEAIVLVGKLPDPLVLQHLQDFLSRAKPDEAGQLLMHIAISAARPARDIVIPMLGHRDALVVDRALRAMTVIGVNNVSQREKVESLLTHEKAMVGIQAATCLGAGDDLRAAPALIRSLQGNKEVAGSALRALQRLSGVDFKNDIEAWNAWYLANRTESAERLSNIVKQLESENVKEQITGVQALGGMRADRLEAIELLEPMLKSTEKGTAIAAQQALATLAPDQYSMPTAKDIIALTKPIVEPPAQSSVIGYLAAQGFFDTWLGLFITAFTAICILSLILYVLRSPPVKNMTQRFKRVVVASTAKFMRPMSVHIKRGTIRIAKAMARKKSELEKKEGTP